MLRLKENIFFLITIVTLLFVGLAFPRASEAATYVVKKGDTLWGIAMKFKTSVKKLQEINHISSALIHPGDILQISADSPQTQMITSQPIDHNETVDSSRGNIQNIIDTAKRFIGFPYRYGGTTPQKGFDCSGFVQYVFSINGIKLPRTASQQASIGIRVTEPTPGDLVFFDTNGSIGHVGIYIGNNAFIHASQSKGITITSLSDSWYRQRYAFTCRIL